MARRDRRRGGAHSAPRKGNGSPADTPAETLPVSPTAEASAVSPTAEASTPDVTGTSADPSRSPGSNRGGTAAVAGAAAATTAGVSMTRSERRAEAEAAGKKVGKKKAKRTWLDKVLLAGVVIVALALVGVGTSYFYVQYRFHQVHKVAVKHLTVAPVGQPFNVLLIGSDSRADVSSTDASHLGTEATAGGQRSDVVKIVHVIPATGQVSVLSIPRDTMVTVAGDTSEIGHYNRINATYNTGPDQLVQTIESNFGIPIEHVVQVNFEGFRGAVDAIGGINLNFPYPAKDVETGLDITSPGCQHLNGGYSLAVARSRDYQYLKNGYWHYDPTGDYGRIQRQNAFMKALINQAESKYNPLTLNAFIGSVVQGVTIDTSFTVSELLSLARQFHTFASPSLATATMPTYSAYSSEFSSFGDVLYVQPAEAEQVMTQFLGQPPDTAFTPPPGPEGVVPATTTTTAGPATGGTTPGTTATSETTTTVETDFDPTPC